MAQDLLLEIGVEELPASFVSSAVESLPPLLEAQLKQMRLGCGEVVAMGTPRRLAVLAVGLSEKQTDLDQELIGPPARVAFDAHGKPTKAAESFARKAGVDVSALYKVEQAKGEYVAARQQSAGELATALLPAALAEVCGKLSFKKSMRWSDGDTNFGRPVRWLLALFGDSIVGFEFAGLTSSNVTYGHRFLAPDAIQVGHPRDYETALENAHVIVDVQRRQDTMTQRLLEAAERLHGELIEDEFLVEENASLVEDPQVVAGAFDETFLQLPERVILDVARDHQRYFGVRSKDGSLMPAYLAVVNTAQVPQNVRRGNDRVMRARLADAKFFYDEDLKKPLADRRKQLDAVLFQKRLGSVGNKVTRIERLVEQLGARLDLDESVVESASLAAGLCKCDLVTLMVGEFPELQGDMGRSYALAQNVEPRVAEAIAEHYQPKGASDPTAPSAEGALVAIADRLDTLVGCCAVGIMPTGSADPLALRRAAIGLVRTIIDKQWTLGIAELVRTAHAGLSDIKLDLNEDETATKLAEFLRQRLRGVLTEQYPHDAVDACLEADPDKPHDVTLRVAALSRLSTGQRAQVGEVFKRAANIAKDAPAGEPKPPSDVVSEVHDSEAALYDAYTRLVESLEAARLREDYASALDAIAGFAPVLGKFFDDVFVMTEEALVRENRLRLMQAIHASCSGLASFNLLAKK